MRPARRLAAAVAAAASAVLALWPGVAAAHEPGTSAVVLEIGEAGVNGTLHLPLDRLEIAVGLPLTAAPAAVVATYGNTIAAYVAAHIAAGGDGGTAWDVELGALMVAAIDGVDHLVVPVTFTPPNGVMTGFTLRDDVILHYLRSHEILVSAGDGDGDRHVLGVLDHATSAVRVDIGGHAGSGSGFRAMVGHGFRHVGAGADHLLFLLVLLLPAPLVVAAGRWGPVAGGWMALRHVVHVMSAFTVGHSITLAASAAGGVEVPSQPVEILIAVSVAAAAVHVIRPLIGHSEAVIAGGFGLVHGLAFAGILHDLGVGRGLAIAPLLGFNLGVELAQLAAVALVFPSLYALATTRLYPVIQIAGATGALVAACAWAANRAGWAPNLLQDIEAVAVDHALAAAAVLATLATVAFLTDRKRAGPVEPPLNGRDRRTTLLKP